jgi:hypothetical protein
MLRDRAVRAARVSGGVGLIAAGVAMLVLPGPGILAVLAGIALLESEVLWIRRWTAPVRARLAPQTEPVRSR